MSNYFKIEELYRPEHRYLSEEDECFYFITYKSYSRHGRTKENVLIMDFKIDVDKDLTNKTKAINTIADMFDQALPELNSPNTIFVPMPPSKTKADSLYDDRMIQVLNIFCTKRKYSDLREILSIKKSVQASHKGGKKSTPEQIIENLIIDKTLCDNPKPNIVLFDDVLTTGAHFKACQTLLRTQFPKSTIKGVFVARTPLH